MAGYILAHSLGVLGEGLNLAGAAVMARDLFLRAKEHAKAVELRGLHEFGLRSGLQTTTYEGVPVTSPDLPLLVLQRYATRLGYVGLSLLMGGFLFLAAYHVIEMWP